MSHFKQYQGDSSAPDGRNLGDEWLDWDGKDGGFIKQGTGLFISFAVLVTVLINVTLCAFVYLITPRLAIWHEGLPWLAWGFATLIVIISIIWFVQFVLTVITKKKIIFSPTRLHPFFEITFAGVFSIADLFGVSRDRVGHSFVRVSNNMSRALKPKGRKENLLLLLPRCLAKEQLKEINELKDTYPVTIHTVSGGELARKKVKETRPTAVIGVACERDLVSGIRDVGTKFFVIGIPNQRPEGPCKNTHIQMPELIEAIEFFVGKPE